MEKKDIRKKVFSLRKQLTEKELTDHSSIICQKILESEEYQNSDTIFVYMDCKGEVSMKLLLEQAWKDGKKVAAPRVTGPGTMKYYYISSYEDVAPGYYDIPEPVTTEEALTEDGLLIVPGVGFDPERHRCGYGQGFYDRYLAAHPEHPTIAVAFEFQMVDQIDINEFDQLPDKLFTEKKNY